MDNEFKEARGILNAVKKAEQDKIRRDLVQCDWDNPFDVALYKRQTRVGARIAVLKRLVPKRICPICGELKPDARAWVVNKKGTEVICRSCFHQSFPDNRVDGITLKRKVFGIPEVRYTIDGFALAAARQEANIGKRMFARDAGWTLAYQTKLEAGDVISVTGEVAYLILQIFNNYNLRTLDTI